MASNQSFPYRHWTPARMRFVFSLLYCLHELDRQMQPSWWICHDRKLKNRLPAMCWWFDSASTESAFQCTLHRFAAALWHCRNKNKLGQNWSVSCFKKHSLVLVPTEWSDTETSTHVQVSWGCIHEWLKAKQRTRYPNWLGNCNNESFTLLSSYETIQ